MRIPLDLDHQIAIRQQVLHHPGVAHIIGELLVLRADAKLPVELV